MLYNVLELAALQDADGRTQQLHQMRSDLLAVIARCVAGASHGYERSKGEDRGFAAAELQQSRTSSRSVSLLIRVVHDGPSLGVAGKWAKESFGLKSCDDVDPHFVKFEEASKSSKIHYVTDELVAALVSSGMPCVVVRTPYTCT